MTDWTALLAAQEGLTVAEYRKVTAERNAASLRRIADHLESSGRRDASGNSAKHFRAHADYITRRAN